ncbi:hypothetical protein LTS17_005726 [Exophiala oligosperma]
MAGTNLQIEDQTVHKPRQRRSTKNLKPGFRVIKFHPKRSTTSRRKVKQETLPSNHRHDRQSTTPSESQTTISRSLGVLKSQRINDWEWDFLSDLLVSSSSPSSATSVEDRKSTSEPTVNQYEESHGDTVIESVLEANSHNDYFKPDNSDSEECSSGAWLDGLLDFSGLNHAAMWQ